MTDGRGGFGDRLPRPPRRRSRGRTGGAPEQAAGCRPAGLPARFPAPSAGSRARPWQTGASSPRPAP
ncbi:hypothetical protein SGM_2016 [Streptomyces griseoaurantiacus M045]|uniref:Uncharacterized protein n=1 Tax=Streptomyces griseoaurantiacus M045 TaxID=996637 RepID=F3NFV2_9ACTN|nr:hypothetical protein SGM_2016 [Streptomyces griseoaurantiacus M045]